MQDIELNNLEEYIPTLADGALHKAYLDTLASGNSVLKVIDNTIYEIFANGEKNKIKDIAPTIKIDINKTIFLK